jgi:uncharacterized protein YcbK (DUF882 family)
MQQIIKSDGTLMELADYQAANHLAADMVSAHFNVSEMDCGGKLLIAEPLLELLEKYRALKGAAVKINSGYRTPEKQKQLKGEGYLAASTSPHTAGMAADIDTTGPKDTQTQLALLNKAAQICGLKIRTGWKQYQHIGQSFIHVDVCPMFFSFGKAFHNQKHPAVWETPISW